MGKPRRDQCTGKRHGDYHTVDARDRDGRTALIIGARRGDDKVVSALLALRTVGVEIDIDAIDNEEYSALMWAADQGNPDVIRALGECGIKTEVRDSAGRTALLIAVSAEQYDAVLELLGLSANPDARDNMGLTVLMYAARSDAPETIVSLRKAGADMELVDDQGCTALMSAVQAAQLRIVIALLQPIPGIVGPNLHATDDVGRNALMLAAAEGMYEAMIAHGADVDAVDDSGGIRYYGRS